MVLCGGFSAEVRAKKMRQDGCTEFISDSLVLIICGKLRLLLDRWINVRMQIRRPCEHTSNLLTSYCILFSLYDDVGANAINGTQKVSNTTGIGVRDSYIHSANVHPLCLLAQTRDAFRRRGMRREQALE